MEKLPVRLLLAASVLLVLVMVMSLLMRMVVRPNRGVSVFRPLPWRRWDRSTRVGAPLYARAPKSEP